jgi:hypothetical protein
MELPIRCCCGLSGGSGSRSADGGQADLGCTDRRAGDIMQEALPRGQSGLLRQGGAGCNNHERQQQNEWSGKGETGGFASDNAVLAFNVHESSTFEGVCRPEQLRARKSDCRDALDYTGAVVAEDCAKETLAVLRLSARNMLF